jgi:diguanylate cyclase (GGDEF)-like protein
MHERPQAERLSWLCPAPGDRERAMDMDRRLRSGRTMALAFVGVALVVCGPWVGWWTVAVLVATAVVFQALRGPIERSRRPEWWIAGGWLLSLVAVAGSVALTGAAHSPAKSWLLVPAITLSSRFSRRGLSAGIALTLLAVVIVTVGLDPGEVADDPQLLLFPAALIGAAMALTMALRSAETEHRSQTVLDQLTGMLNRQALEQRVAELELQSRVSGQPVGLIVCDIDHFKAMNDTHGHAMGDAVLKDVAYRIRKTLRAYDLAYRLGGEEFVVLVPGANVQRAVILAEKLGAEVADDWVEGVPVTMSCGVAASDARGFEFGALFAEADEALYRAKAGGRNRVCTVDAPAFAVLC